MTPRGGYSSRGGNSGGRVCNAPNPRRRAARWIPRRVLQAVLSYSAPRPSYSAPRGGYSGGAVVAGTEVVAAVVLHSGGGGGSSHSGGGGGVLMEAAEVEVTPADTAGSKGICLACF